MSSAGEMSSWPVPTPGNRTTRVNRIRTGFEKWRDKAAGQIEEQTMRDLCAVELWEIGDD